MRLVVDKKELFDALRLVGGVLPPRSISPILSNLLFTAEEGYLHILGTDQDITLTAKLPAEIMEEGSIGLPARKMTDQIKELAEGAVELISHDESRLSIKQRKGEYKITGVKAVDFPSVDIVGDVTSTMAMERDLFSRMINLTSFAIARDLSRLNLNALYLKIKENLVSVAATDALRLAVFRHVVQTVNADTELLIPSRTVDQIKKVFSSTGEKEVVISVGARAFRLEAGQFTLQSKLVRERFPDYESVLPKDNDKEVLVDKSEFMSALSRVGVLTNPTSALVKISLDKGNITFTGRDYEIGSDAHDEVACEYDGDPFTIAFHYRYLYEITDHIESERVKLTFKAANTAVGVYPVPAVEGETHISVLMPLRLPSED
jgi:DNA polymerase-3 subunit beta